jgi:hypothetical protein
MEHCGGRVPKVHRIGTYLTMRDGDRMKLFLLHRAIYQRDNGDRHDHDIDIARWRWSVDKWRQSVERLRARGLGMVYIGTELP